MSKPRIRIKGFSGEWSETQLKDFTSRIVRKNIGLQSNLPLTVSAQYGLVGQDTFFNSRIASANIAGYYLVKKGEFAYNKSSSQGYPYGAVKRLDLHEKGVLSTLYIVFDIDEEKVDSDYVVSYFDAATWHNEVRLRAAEGARNHGLLNISADDFFDIKILLPQDINEQRAIGTFFALLNKEIAVLSDSVSSLQALRKGFLNSLFPQGESEEPMVRLKGFSGSWEKKALGEIAIKVKEKNATHEVDEVFTNSAVHGIISQRDFFDHDVAKKANTGGYYIVSDNDFVYNPRISVTSPVGPINRNRTGRKGVMSPLYTVFRTHDINSVFLEHYFKSSSWHRYMRFNGNTGARFDRFSITNEDFFKMPIPVPSPEEQAEIAEFFENLNKEIEHNKEELERLKALKQSCLQGMFV